jgi:hypothetical protein
MQTDKVIDIPCGTSGGTMLKIERVEGNGKSQTKKKKKKNEK